MSLLLLFHGGSAGGGGGGFQAVWALDDEEYTLFGNMKKNVASQVVGVQMVSATDGSAFTGSVTCVITKDGGAQSASGGTGPTHEGNGFHTYLPTQAETNADHIGFTFTGTGAVPKTIQIYTTFPQTGDSYAEVTSVTYGLSVIENLVDALETAATNIETDTQDIQTRLPAALVGGRMDSNMGAISSDSVAADNAEAFFDGTGYAGTNNVIPTVTNLTTNNDKTGYALGVGGIAATAFAAGAINAAALAADAGQEIADEVLDRNIAGGGSGNTRNVRNALRSLRNKQTISGGTLTIYQEDDSTSAWTAAVTTAANDPITDIDPA